MGVTVRSASGQGHQEQQSRKSLMFGRDLFFFEVYFGEDLSEFMD